MTKESLLKALEEEIIDNDMRDASYWRERATYKAIALVHAHWPEEVDLGFKVKKWSNGVPELESTTPAKPGEDELIKEIKRLEELVYVPGLWKCAKCKCTTVCTNLHVNTGGFSANNSPQRCPNDCGPMWRVTERASGNELIDRFHKQSTTPHGQE